MRRDVCASVRRELLSAKTHCIRCIRFVNTSCECCSLQFYCELYNVKDSTTVHSFCVRLFVVSFVELCVASHLKKMHRALRFCSSRRAVKRRSVDVAPFGLHQVETRAQHIQFEAGVN